MIHIATMVDYGTWELFVFENPSGLYSIAWSRTMAGATSADPKVYETFEQTVEYGVTRFHSFITVYHHPLAAKIGLKIKKEAA